MSRPADLTGETSSLSDRLKIAELLARYARCIDTGRPRLLSAEVFAAEVEVDLGQGVWRGADEAARRIAATSDRFAGTLHLLGNSLIEVAGEEATSSCCFVAYHWLTPADGAAPMAPADLVLAGMYEDEHRRTEVGWRITRRRFRRLGSSSVVAGEFPDFLRPQAL